MMLNAPSYGIAQVGLAQRLGSYRRALLRSTSHMCARRISMQVFQRADEGTFGTSSAIAARYRFVQPSELRAALVQFCQDIGYQDMVSIPAMETNKVFHSSLAEFWSKRQQFFAPHAQRDADGEAAAAFMAAQALAILFDYNAVIDSAPIAVPLVDHVMRRGAQGLYDLAIGQFDMLAQICVDLTDWLIRSCRNEVVLVEAPLGNTVPVAVLACVAGARGVKVSIVEWGCPRNDRALNGRTVDMSARDLAALPEVVAAPFVLFIDDAITGSRFLKMAKALRRAVGPERLGAVGSRPARSATYAMRERARRNLACRLARSHCPIFPCSRSTAARPACSKRPWPGATRATARASARPTSSSCFSIASRPSRATSGRRVTALPGRS